MSVPVVVIDDQMLTVEPGQVVETVVRIRNAGAEVEQYAVEVLGASRAWSDVVPRHVSLMPGDERDIRVLFRPPRRPAAPVGEFPYGVRCASQVDPDRCAVAEGDIAVGAIHGLEARLVTVTGRGRRRGRYRLDVHNTGTVPATVGLAVFEAAESLSFALRPDRLEIAPGATSSAYMLVRPLSPTLLGSGSSHPFWLTYEVEGSVHHEGRVDGVFTRRPVLPRALIPATVAVIVLGVAGVVAMSMLRGSPTSGADGAVAPPSAPTLKEVRSTPEGVQIQWTSTPRVETYSVQQLVSQDVSDVIDSQKVPGDQQALRWPKDLPAGQQCFRVRAVNPGGASQPSAVNCVGVVTSKGPPVTDITGAFAIVASFIAADVDAYPRAQSELVRLSDAGVQVKLIDNRQSKVLDRGGADSYVLLADGFADAAGARAFCKRNADLVTNCSPFPPTS